MEESRGAGEAAPPWPTCIWVLMLLAPRPMVLLVHPGPTGLRQSTWAFASGPCGGEGGVEMCR